MVLLKNKSVHARASMTLVTIKNVSIVWGTST